MTITDGGWVALYSGGKDSYLALAAAERSGRSVDQLVTVDAPAASYLYHVPATVATGLAAESMGRDHVALDLAEAGSTSSEAAAAHEIEPLASWLAERVGTADAPVGLVSGVVASDYQYELLSDLCDRFDLQLYAPLWSRSVESILDAVRQSDLQVDVVGVAAAGLDQSWLGRRLDAAAIAELRSAAADHGIHPAGEGGEFETLVVDAPLFSRPINYQATRVWAGTHGHLELERAWLAESTSPTTEG